MLTNTGSNTGGVNRATNSSTLGQHAPTNVAQSSKATGSGVKCFECREIGHQQSICKKKGKKALFTDTDDYEEDDGYVGEKLVLSICFCPNQYDATSLQYGRDS